MEEETQFSKETLVSGGFNMEAWRKELYLAHHGILGQKWGVRRYQNDDGSLTPAGVARYRSKKSYMSDEKRMSKDYSVDDDKLLRRLAKSNFGRHKIAKQKEVMATNLANMVEANNGDASRIKKARDAQRLANKEYAEYEKHTSTGRLIAQDLLLGKAQSGNYRAARARGESRVRALMETGGLIGAALNVYGNKRRYGSYDAYMSDSSGEWM